MACDWLFMLISCLVVAFVGPQCGALVKTQHKSCQLMSK